MHFHCKFIEERLVLLQKEGPMSDEVAAFISEKYCRRCQWGIQAALENNCRDIYEFEEYRKK